RSNPTEKAGRSSCVCCYFETAQNPPAARQFSPPSKPSFRHQLPHIVRWRRTRPQPRPGARVSKARIVVWIGAAAASRKGRNFEATGVIVGRGENRLHLIMTLKAGVVVIFAAAAVPPRKPGA